LAYLYGNYHKIFIFLQQRKEIIYEIIIKYTLREWHLVPAYEQASKVDYTRIKELQEIMTNPYDEQSQEIEDKYYIPKPTEFFNVAGISHVSCSS
jgi:uncharacterized protein YdiU (UPF0061 family)